MARIETWYEQDINKAVKVQYLDGNVFSMDNSGNLIGVVVTDNGAAATLTGSVSANVIRADNMTVAVSGTLSGNKCYVVLPQTAYLVPGPLAVIIKLTSGSVITTVCAVVANVYQSSTDSTVDPGTIIPSIQTLISQIQAAVASIPADYSDLWTSLAPAFRTDTAYSVGQYVTYNGNLYRFVAAHAAGTWNTNHVTKIAIGTDLFTTRKQVSTNTERLSETFCGDYADATEITSGQDFNNFVTPGNYVATTTAVVQSCTNYPVASPGRLYVFSSMGTTAFIQIYIASSSEIYARRVSTANPSSNTAWKRMTTGAEVDNLMGNAIRSQGLAASDADVDNFPNGSIIGVATSNINTVAHFPKDYQSGGAVITTGYLTTGSVVGRLQICYFFNNDYYAWRRNIDALWTDWHYEGIVTITRTVKTSGGSFSDVIGALKYYTNPEYMGLWNEHYRLEIVIDPGTWSLNSLNTIYSQDTTRYKYGMYIPPFCTIRGAGKHRTILKYTPTYSDPSDEMLASVSPFNMPYESSLQDLDLIVQNCRYCVHSETNFPGYSDGTNPINSSRIRNCTITIKNVYFEHKGFDSQYTPRYTAPACWGNGSYDNSNETFIDCDFVSSQYAAWLSHNRIGLTLPSTFIFENCTFVNKSERDFSALGTYCSMMFISWAEDDIKLPVKMVNCYANRFVLLSVRSGDPASDNPKNNYFVTADNGIMITEQTTNNAHRTDNYRTGNCNALYANADLTVAYRPVSFNDDGGAHAYSNADPYHGIVLHTATAGDEITVQIKGKIELARCGISGFAAGTLLGYSNGAWVADSVHPIIKCMTANVGMIV